MPTNEEIQNRLIEALSARAPTPVCPLCNNNRWNVAQGYIVLPASPDPRQIHMGGRIHPLIAVTCSNCGNTHLINLLTLGFQPDDFQELRIENDAEQQP